MNWIDPVVKDFLFYNSPWKTAAGKRNLLDFGTLEPKPGRQQRREERERGSSRLRFGLRQPPNCPKRPTRFPFSTSRPRLSSKVPEIHCVPTRLSGNYAKEW
jgi:hypothetical protein